MVLDWVINWLSENGNASMEEMKNHLDDNYFELGYVDSFTFILMMGAVEGEFGISFDNDRFQDRSFSTLNGFAKAIEEEMAK